MTLAYLILSIALAAIAADLWLVWPAIRETINEDKRKWGKA